MLDFSERIVSHVILPYFFLISGNAVILPYFFLISGNAPLIISFILKSKNMFTIFTISLLMYDNNSAFKIVAKIPLLLPLVLRV